MTCCDRSVSNALVRPADPGHVHAGGAVFSLHGAEPATAGTEHGPCAGPSARLSQQRHHRRLAGPEAGQAGPLRVYGRGGTQGRCGGHYWTGETAAAAQVRTTPLLW